MPTIQNVTSREFLDLLQNEKNRKAITMGSMPLIVNGAVRITPEVITPNEGTGRRCLTISNVVFSNEVYIEGDFGLGSIVIQDGCTLHKGVELGLRARFVQFAKSAVVSIDVGFASLIGHLSVCNCTITSFTVLGAISEKLFIQAVSDASHDDMGPNERGDLFISEGRVQDFYIIPGSTIGCAVVDSPTIAQQLHLAGVPVHVDTLTAQRMLVGEPGPIRLKLAGGA